MEESFDTIWTHFPVCPHCGEEDFDWWDGQPQRWDGDEWQVDCGWCNKEYSIIMSISTLFWTRKDAD